jgi:hypothetical protein
VVVVGAGGSEEGHAATLSSDLLEAEGSGVEFDTLIEVTDVEDRVVQAGDGDRGVL